MGGLLNKLGKSKPTLTGEGQMMRVGEFKADITTGESPGLNDYLVGIVVSTAFFTWGVILSKFIGQWFEMHSYAYMIISVAIFKALNIIPDPVAKGCSSWYKFVAGNFTAALMLGIGISYTNLGQIISAFTPQYIVLCALVIIGAVLGTGLVGYLLGFNFIEAAITAGLCMAIWAVRETLRYLLQLIVWSPCLSHRFLPGLEEPLLSSSLRCWYRYSSASGKTISYIITS